LEIDDMVDERWAAGGSGKEPLHNVLGVMRGQWRDVEMVGP
jgi:hypothetical protein